MLYHCIFPLKDAIFPFPKGPVMGEKHWLLLMDGIIVTFSKQNIEMSDKYAYVEWLP